MQHETRAIPTYDELLAIINDRYEASVRQAQVERDADIAALNRFESVLRNAFAHQSCQPNPPAPASAPEQTDTGYGRLAQLIRDEVNSQTLGTLFTIRTLCRGIEDRHSLEINPTTVAGVVSRLVRAGEVRCVRAGSGKRGTLYARRIALIPENSEKGGDNAEG